MNDPAAWPEGPSLFGQTIIAIPESTNYRDFADAALKGLQADDGWNNPNPLPENTVIDRLIVRWGAAPQPTAVRDLVFPVATHLTEDNFERVLQYLLKRNGYDFIMVVIKEPEEKIDQAEGRKDMEEQGLVNFRVLLYVFGSFWDT